MKFSLARVWDGLALLAIAYVVWRLFIAPRALDLASAYPAPATSYARLDGGTFRVRDARGRLLFLDFYASWCEPCRVELPLVEAWAKTHPDALVVPVDVGEPRALAGAFAQHHELVNVAYDPNGRASAEFAIQGYPTVVVIDPQNRVRAKWEGLNPAIAVAMDNARRQLATPLSR